MKKILAFAAVAALTAGASAYAANPFSDVSTDDWAYQAVADLSQQGVVDGYLDGTFKGERNMTRYELAQIIARLMAKEDQLNGEQQATLDKLAGEYADELAQLGVRVGNLEKKAGNLYWSGDARMRYQDKGNDQDNWDGRMRINVKGEVNDDTYVQGRLTTHMKFKDAAEEDKDGDTNMDQLYVNHNFGSDVSLRLGRQPIVFGNQGGWLINPDSGYDGVQMSYNHGQLSLTTGFGQLNLPKHTMITNNTPVLMDYYYANRDVYFAQGAYDFGFARLDATYAALKDAKLKSMVGDMEAYGVGLNVPIQQFNLFGEYWKNTTWTQNTYDTAWNAGLSYGKADWKKPGSWDLLVAYNDVGNGLNFAGATGLQTSPLDLLTSSGYSKPGGQYDDGAQHVTFWNAMANVTLQKNVQLHAEYAFDVDQDGGKKPVDDSWTVSLNYQF